MFEFQTPDGFALTHTPDGTWQEKGEILKARRLTFKIDGIHPNPGARKLTASVSFRAERLHEPEEELHFDAGGLLAGDNRFRINGLSLEEAAAEKILGWSTKVDMPKHFADLALLARDNAQSIRPDLAADLLARKFDIERNAGWARERYKGLGLRYPSDLQQLCFDDTKLADARSAWSSQIGQTIWLTREERGRGDQSIENFDLAEQLVREFWGPVLSNL